MTDLAEYLANNYGTCALDGGCTCLRTPNSWEGKTCRSWRPTPARNWKELKEWLSKMRAGQK